jgi:pyruvate kinase
MKIICSSGPKVSTTEVIHKFYNAGMDIIRFNFSHVDYDTTKNLINYSRKNLPGLKILQDLQGVKLRVSEKYNRIERKVLPGQELLFCSENEYLTVKSAFPHIIPIHFDGKFSSLLTVKTIFMKDATMKFHVKETQNNLIKTTVERGGIIRARKALNAPGMDRTQIQLTEKDKRDLKWGLNHSIDIVCLSFVCSNEQIKELKKFIRKEIGKNKSTLPKIWAKIETKEGFDNFTSILKNVDGIMLGRGDLAPEVGLYNVPEIQSVLLKKMKNNKKDFVIATQILGSMTQNPIPSRSELNDIYTCIKNKVTGFMLTSETGIGKYPVLAINTLKEMINKYNNKQTISLK